MPPFLPKKTLGGPGGAGGGATQARASVPTRSSRLSAPGGWARSTARATSGCGRDVAIKVLSADLAGDAERRKRFEQEARAASSLNHPNIVTIYDIGATGDVVYIAMELIEGRTLRDFQNEGPLPTKRLLDVAFQIADGLAKAHAAGIVHRDLKPENIMVTRDGVVKILDFGLVKLLPREDGMGEDSATAIQETRPGTVLGTVGYMSPEQASGKPADFRSDQFSLGSILYEVATGKRAFQRATTAETLTAIIREEAEPVGKLNASVPAPFRWLIERCLAKEPDGRYASTRDLASDLRSIREHLSEASVRPASPGLAGAIAGAAPPADAADFCARSRPRRRFSRLSPPGCGSRTASTAPRRRRTSRSPSGAARSAPPGSLRTARRSSTASRGTATR